MYNTIHIRQHQGTLLFERDIAIVYVPGEITQINDDDTCSVTVTVDYWYTEQYENVPATYVKTVTPADRVLYIYCAYSIYKIIVI